jgi:hypothetical protein
MLKLRKKCVNRDRDVVIVYRLSDVVDAVDSQAIGLRLVQSDQ